MERAAYVHTYGHQPIDNNVCASGHNLNTLIVQRFFNCVAKNLAKELTNKANTGQPAKKRKIVKLSGSSKSQ
jgi:hypothetical protein